MKNMQYVPGLAFGDRTTATTTNGVTTGHAMDMHYRGATLRYNVKLHGYAMHGEIGENARVLNYKDAVTYIQKLAAEINK